MSKVLPKISAPGSSKFPNGGGRNPNVGTRGSGLAPKPKYDNPLVSQTKGSGPVGGGIARVPSAGTSATGVGNTAGSFMPVKNNANANQHGRTIGQSEASFSGGARVSPKTKTPVTGNPVATNKPQRKGLGSKFYGEY